MTQVQDVASHQLEALVSPEVLNAAFGQGLRELGQLVRGAFDDAKLGPNADGRNACPALQKAMSRVQQRLQSWIQPLSPLHWLWLIRRLPDHVFAGDLRSTSVYDRTLAEVISSRSGCQGKATLSDPQIVSYPFDASTVRQLARFVGGIKVLSQLHVEYRWAAKGARITIGRDNRIYSSASAALREAVSLYDKRCNELGEAHGRTGTVVFEPWRDDSSSIVSVRPIDPTWASYPGTIPGVGRDAKIFIRYLPDPSWRSVAQVLALSAELPTDTVWTEETEVLLLLMRLGLFYGHRHRAGWVDVLQRGYLMVNEEFLSRNADLFVRGDPVFFSSYAPHIRVQSGRELLERFVTLPPPSSWPVIAGPVLRRDGDVYCLDLAAATLRLESCLQYPSTTGALANVRARHFEDAVQVVIDASSWRPSDQLRELRGRALRRDAQPITDLDAIGEKDGTILLVSCKSVIYSDRYDIGDHRVVRNCAETVNNAVSQWASKVASLSERPGDNFDLSGRRIVRAVCTPQVVYVELGGATEEVASGLRACSALGELKRWLAKDG